MQEAVQESLNCLLTYHLSATCILEHDEHRISNRAVKEDIGSTTGHSPFSTLCTTPVVKLNSHTRDDVSQLSIEIGLNDCKSALFRSRRIIRPFIINALISLYFVFLLSVFSYIST